MNIDYIARIELEETRLLFLLDLQGNKLPRAEVLDLLRNRAKSEPCTYEQVLDKAIANANAGMPL